MEKLSLFPYLLRRFGAVFGVMLVFISGFYYWHENAAKTDRLSLSLLQDSLQRLELATSKGQRYLDTGKSKDLEEYNRQIIQLGKDFADLVENFKKFPELQNRFLNVQNKSREYFLSLNAKIAERQNGAFHGDSSAAADVQGVTQLVDGMIHDLRENGSQSVNVFGIVAPEALWISLAGLLFAAFCILRAHQLQEKAYEDQVKDVEALNKQSILLDGILNSISEALIVIDEQGRFTRYNTASQRLIGSKIKSIATEEDAQEFGFFDVTTMKQLTLLEMPFAKALCGESVDDLEILVHNEAHSEGIYISISSRFLSDIDGRIYGALVVFRDISRRKATEQEWLRAREAALETARKKSDFLAAMSHEIRTPMNGVMGMATLLNETSLTEEQKDYVGTIRRSADALLRLINDILDHSKIEAGKVQMNLRPFDLKTLAEDVLELFFPTVREKNIGLELKLSEGKDWYYVGDPERLRQVLVNLIGNAVKFTETGSVSIGIEKVKSYGGKASLKFSVTDTGAGMSEEESQFLFQKYFQTKSGMKYGGTGLGLSICHQLVELMGGKIGLQSRVGMGSTFWFTIELPETTVDQIPTQKEHHFAPLFRGQILLAEDQLVNQRVAVTYLQKLGLQVDVANNGQIAVEKSQSKTYDLIFMDCQMPVMTGYEATQKIRQLQGSSRTPIIALTAEGTSGERQSCIAVGMDDFLTKPLELDRLVDVLHRWLKSAPQILDKKALEKLNQFMVNNKSLTQALIEDFAKTAPDLVAEMSSSLEQANLEKIQEAAHALKSASGTLGAVGLAELCQNIENGNSLQDVQAWVAQAQEHLTQSLQELQKYATRTAA